jgi:branched-chain amino acid transport system permease protein
MTTAVKDAPAPRAARNYLSVTWITLALALVVAVVVSFQSPSLLVDSLVKGGMWALIAAGLALVFGVMNVPNFAHGEFFMLGTLAAYSVFTPLHKALGAHASPLLTALAPFAGILAALAVGALVGLALELVVFRQLRKRSKAQWVMNSFLLTAGVSVIIINGTQLLAGTEFKGITRYWEVRPIEFLRVMVTVDRIVVFLLAVVTIALFWLFMRRSRLGRAMRAVAQDEVGAQMVGIELNRVHLITMALSSALAALAGASLLFMFPSYPTVGLKPLYVAWYVVILAGLGNVEGAIAGGFIVALLQNLTSYYISVGWEDVVPTALIILILLFKPSGLFGSEVKGVWEQ